MTDFDYPPSWDVSLEEALSSVEADLEDARGRVDKLEDDEDATNDALAEAYSRRQRLESNRDALEWAVQQFGEGARVSMTAFTATTRARTLDEIQRTAVGQVGNEETRIWLLAAALDDAPWLDPGDDLADAYRITGELPPALQDYLDDQLTDLNDLSEGNS
jgi:exonuclease VII small subunit